MFEIANYAFTKCCYPFSYFSFSIGDSQKYFTIMLYIIWIGQVNNCMKLMLHKLKMVMLITHEKLIMVPHDNGSSSQLLCVLQRPDRVQRSSFLCLQVFRRGLERINPETASYTLYQPVGPDYTAGDWSKQRQNRALHSEICVSSNFVCHMEGT